MTKHLGKAIMNKSKTRNRYLKWSSRENFLAMKSAKNLCNNNLIKTNKKSYFQKVTQNGFANNKTFWNIIKPFSTNKGFLTSDSISLTQENETITDKKTITHSLNTHYVNIVKKTSGKASEIQGNPNNKPLDMSTVKSIITKYENHSSIININNKVVKCENRYNIPYSITNQQDY